jgi:hypothetical protein
MQEMQLYLVVSWDIQGEGKKKKGKKEEKRRKLNPSRVGRLNLNWKKKGKEKHRLIPSL